MCTTQKPGKVKLQRSHRSLPPRGSGALSASPRACTTQMLAAQAKKCSAHKVVAAYPEGTD